MQVQPISNQSFGQIRIKPKTMKHIKSNGLSDVELKDIRKIVANHKNIPTIAEISHSKNGKLVAEIGYMDPSVKIFVSEDSYGGKISHHDFIDKVAKITKLIHEKKMDAEDIRLLGSKIGK